MKYVLGIDYGTLSGRVALYNASNGEAVGYREYIYPHAVMGRQLDRDTDGGWALQHPSDYLGVLSEAIPALLAETGVSASEVAGIGVDFTACTMMTVDADLCPVCLINGYESNPYAYALLWKHHAAQKYADRINAVFPPELLVNYGGRTSSEWLFAKLLSVYCEAPEIADKAALVIEAGDWIVSRMTGRLHRSTCMAGYKAMWTSESGYPTDDMLEKLAPGFAGYAASRLKGCHIAPGNPAGSLTEEMAKLTGLRAGTPVSACIIDAHAAVPAAGIDSSGKLLMIIGTSGCQLLLSEKQVFVPGIFGVVRDGVIPGLYAYEAGQAAVGDSFGSFIEKFVPSSYNDAAKAQGMNLHKYLRSLCAGKKPGETGLIALDWFNGNRSVLNDSELSGMIIGLTLQSSPEDVYRALIEATAFGMRKIIENFEQSGVEVRELFASGGIPRKDELMMHIYSDVTGRKITVADNNGAVFGSAIYGAAAAGVYSDVPSAVKAMVRDDSIVYTPDPDNVKLYDGLYSDYLALHDYFGCGGNDIMHRLYRHA